MTWKEQYNKIKAYTEKIASTCRVAQPPYIMQIHVLSIHTMSDRKTLYKYIFSILFCKQHNIYIGNKYHRSHMYKIRKKGTLPS